MSKDGLKFPAPADPNSAGILNRSLGDMEQNLKPSTHRKYEDLLHLFAQSLNNYTYSGVESSFCPVQNRQG